MPNATKRWQTLLVWKPSSALGMRSAALNDNDRNSIDDDAIPKVAVDRAGNETQRWGQAAIHTSYLGSPGRDMVIFMQKQVMFPRQLCIFKTQA